MRWAWILLVGCSGPVPGSHFEVPEQWAPRLVWKLVARPKAQIENRFYEVRGYQFPLRAMGILGSVYFFDFRGEVEEIVPSRLVSWVSDDGTRILATNGTGSFGLFNRSGDLLWQKEGFEHGALSPDGSYAVLESKDETLLVSWDGKILSRLSFKVGRPAFSQDGALMIASTHMPGREGIALIDSRGGLVFEEHSRGWTVGSTSLSADGSRAAYVIKDRSGRVFVKSVDSEGILQWVDNLGFSYSGCALSERGNYLLALGQSVKCYENWTGSVVCEYFPKSDSGEVFLAVEASAVENPELFAITFVEDVTEEARLFLLDSSCRVIWAGEIEPSDYWVPAILADRRLLALRGESSFLLYDLSGLKQLD